MRHVSVREEALPVLNKLARQTGESVYLIILDNDEALCLEKVDGHHLMKVLFLQIGGRMPLHIGAEPEKVLLASLPDEEVDRIIKIKGLVAMTQETITNPYVLKEELKKIRAQGYALILTITQRGQRASLVQLKTGRAKLWQPVVSEAMLIIFFLTR